MSARVFVDTSAYFALTDRRDNNHALAEATARRFTQEGAELYTTNFIMAETHALLLNRIGRDIAAQVLERLYASETRILRATESDERRAREIIAQHRDKDYSFADAISFVVMQRPHLQHVWTYDQHFSQFGFARVN